MANAFATKLRQILFDRNMNCTDLARLIWKTEYVTPSTGQKTVKGKEQVAKYVRGAIRPSRERYKQILEALNLTPADLPLRGASSRSVSNDKNSEQLKLNLLAPNNSRNVPKAKSASINDLIAAMERLTQALNKLAD